MDLQINISTPRLHLRLMEESDAKDVLEILGDKETAELGGISSLSTLDDAIDYIQGYTPVGYLVSIVKDNPQGEVVGIMEVYPKYLFFGHEAPRRSYCLVYYTKKTHRGNGYMTEAVKAIEEELFLQGVSQISVGIYPRNDASKKVASRCGFVLDGLYKDFLEFSDEHKEDVEFYHVDNPYQLAS